MGKLTEAFHAAMFTILVTASMICACASLPPRKAVTNLGEIQGEWSGTIYSQSRATPVVIHFSADGSFSWDTADHSGSGVVTLRDNTMYIASSSGSKATMTLHGQVGKQILRIIYIGIEASGTLSRTL